MSIEIDDESTTHEWMKFVVAEVVAGLKQYAQKAVITEATRITELG